MGFMGLVVWLCEGDLDENDSKGGGGGYGVGGRREEGEEGEGEKGGKGGKGGWSFEVEGCRPTSADQYSYRCPKVPAAMLDHEKLKLYENVS
ncbi:hypothetical protein V1477_016047 [Vespula maculifrons]|uniref:Uncharacterized protein n=1 Tax=Vespula maculifrons TaxID=7453 RepID=A0ABD2BBY8_VESMC